MNKLGTRGLLYSSPCFFLKGTEAVLLPKPVPTTTRRMVGAGACKPLGVLWEVRSEKSALDPSPKRRQLARLQAYRCILGRAASAKQAV